MGICSNEEPRFLPRGGNNEIRKYIDERIRALVICQGWAHPLLLVVGCFLSDLIAVEAQPVVSLVIGFINVFGI